MNNNLSHLSSNLNSSEEAYLSLANSYITATREILNGYITFETGITRVINNQIFRNFTRPSSTTTAPPSTTTAPPSTTTAPPSTTTAPPSTTTAHPSTTTAPLSTTTTRGIETEATREIEVNVESSPVTETPVGLIRREIQIPNAPSRIPSRFRFNPPSNSSPPLSPFQTPTPVRLTNRLDTPLSQTTQNASASTSTPRPPFASSFVRYRLPVPIGPPRRVPSTNENNANINLLSNVRRVIEEVPVFSPPQSPPSDSPPHSPPPLLSQTWQQLRQRQQEQRQQEQAELNSLSPIRPIEPTPLPPVPAPLTTATRLMLNLLDTPRLNDSLIYYTQIIDRELLRSRDQNRSLSYDTIQQQTTIIPYCTIVNPLNDICPISQVQFDVIDSVMQIKICKHNFNPYSLLRWFDSNSTCPMCRREINVDSENENNNDNDDDEHPIHMYNDEEEPYRSQPTRNYDDYDSDYIT